MTDAQLEKVTAAIKQAANELGCCAIAIFIGCVMAGIAMWHWW